MAIFYVDNVLDVDDGNHTTGNLSLREAIGLADAAAGADTIGFISALGGSVLLLNGTRLIISSDITIDGDTNGDNVADITISGTGISSIFDFASGTSTIDALTITQSGYLLDAVRVSGSANLTVTNSTMTGNAGRGISNLGNDLTITNSTISNNTGGGIFNSVIAGNLNIVSSTISGNSASAGAGVLANAGIVTITSSTISGNTATQRGGGISNSTNLTLENTTISGNLVTGSTGGGGISNVVAASQLYINHSTITGNRASLGSGGGIRTENASSSVTFTDSIVAGNLSNNQAPTNDVTLAGTGIYNGVNIFSTAGNGDAEDIIETNLHNIFASVGTNPNNAVNAGILGDYGGNVQTVAIKQGGVAHNGGAVGSPQPFDARGAGFARIADGGIDIGAFEFDPANNPVPSAAFVVDTHFDIDDGNITAGNFSLREAIRLANETGGDDVITFSAALAGQSITLVGTQLSISSDVIIDGDTNGDNVADITISGGGTSRVFAVTNGIVTLDALTITGGNTSGANGGAGLFVGALADVTLVNSTITGNAATGSAHGGGIYTSSGTLSVLDSLISNNTTAGYGGGIGTRGATTITNSTISGNTATKAAGGIYNTTATGVLTVTNSTISENTGGFFGGGGISNSFGSGGATITNSTISGNTTSGSNGGGIYNRSTLTVENTTISGNKSNFSGDGVYTNSSQATFSNSIIAGNGTIGKIDIANNGTATYLGTNVFAQAGLGDAQDIIETTLTNIFDSVTANPHSGIQSGELADNGGDVETIAILQGGVAHNTGDDAVLPADTQDIDGDTNVAEDIPFDARGTGFARIVGAQSDVGSFEHVLAGPPPLTVTTLDDETAATTDLATETADGNGLSLREAIAIANANVDATAINFDAALAGGALRLTQGTLTISTDVTIEGDTNADNVADILITGDANGDDTLIGATGITDIAASTIAGTLVDNTRILIITGTDVTLDALTITGGRDVVGVAGGMYISPASSVTILNSTLSGNSADNGGAIFNYGGAIYLTDTTLSGNSASQAGGINSSGMATLTNVTLSGNTATNGSGGAIINSGTAVLTNTTLAGNSAINGGGIWNNTGVTTLINTTLSGNTASNIGGGILSYASTPTLTNSLVLGNNAVIDAEISGAFTNNTSIVSGVATTVFAATSLVGGIQAGVLADNGGPVQTIALLAGVTNLALDAGVDASAPALDARGIARFDQLTSANNGANISDLGAFELQADIITGDANDNVLNGTLGNDIFNGLGGNDTLNGGANGAGGDTASFITEASSVEVRLNVGTAVGASSGSDTLISIENVEGSNFDDTIFGDNFANVLNGNGGADSIFALGDADTVNGGAGNDTLNGNLDGDLMNGDGGDDLVLGAQGNDTLNGGDDNDTVSGGSGDDTVSGGAGMDLVFGGGDNDTLTGNDGNDVLSGGGGIDNVDGGNDDDLVLGAAGNDTVLGGAGADTVSGGSGLDEVDGGAGNDQVFGAGGNDTISGGAGNDTVSGGTEDDQIFGNADIDNLIGASGNDTLDGGTGNDILTGGSGADTLVFAQGYEFDTVQGFEDNIDTLQLDEALWGGGLTAAQVVTTFATQLSPGIVEFDFGGGDILRVINGAGITTTALVDDIAIV